MTGFIHRMLTGISLALTTAARRYAMPLALGFALTAVGSAFAADPTPPPIDPTGVRSPAPAGVALDRAERRVADAYEVESADKTDAGRRKLLQLMLNDATQTRDDLAGRYVMLREARRLAGSLNESAITTYLSHEIETLYSIVNPGSAADPTDSIPAMAPAKSRPRLPVPSDAAFGDARKKLRAKYSTYYANTTALVRSSLLQKLLLDIDVASEAADQYAALREAAEIAVAVGDLKTATQCNSIMASVYQVSETDLRLQTLAAGAPQLGKLIPARDLAQADLDLADDAVKADNFDVAASALRLAMTAVPAAADETLTARYRKRDKEIRDMRDEYQRVALSLKKLATSPDDKDVNFKVGKFYCLSVGNWAKGLPMLMKGSDIGMKLLAESELAHPTTADAELKLADAWWDRSSAELGSASTHCKQRAGYWYRRVEAASPPALPDRVTARLLTTAYAVDLMALMNASRDRVSGTWTGAAGRLSCTNAGVSRLQFPATVPEEYDFAITFTIHRPGDRVVQIVPSHDSYFAWSMGTNHTGFETLDPSSKPVYNPFTFVTNKAYLSVVEVRRSGVRVKINGTVVAEWKTNFSDFTPPPNWKLGDPRMLGFGSAFTEVTLQSARLIDLSSAEE